MKLVTFERGGSAGIGVLLDDGLAPVGAFADMLALIAAGEEGLASARAAMDGRDRIPLDRLRLRAPIPEPPQMRDALTFERHLRQARANRHLFAPDAPRRSPEEIDVPSVWYEQPIYYKCSRFAVSGPEDTIEWPRGESWLDYELELAVVIGGADRTSRRPMRPGAGSSWAGSCRRAIGWSSRSRGSAFWRTPSALNRFRSRHRREPSRTGIACRGAIARSDIELAGLVHAICRPEATDRGGTWNSRSIPCRCGCGSDSADRFGGPEANPPAQATWRLGWPRPTDPVPATGKLR